VEVERMRIFVAGGSGVMGRHLVPLLVEAGHAVTASTRTEAKLDLVRALGAEAVVCDVYDRVGLTAVLTAARPEVIVQQLTDLPDDPAQLAAGREANARIRQEGTDHLLAAAAAAGVERLVVQSIAWLTDGVRPPSVVHLERRTRSAGAVVLRYGQWYGPGTYHPDEPPPMPRVHVRTAAEATVTALDLAPGTYLVTDDGTEAADDA
jgi:nucleoside-diphosphate-sugar epimerase